MLLTPELAKLTSFYKAL